MAFNWTDIVSLILNLVLGSGFLITFLNLKSERKKAASEAKGAEATAEGTELDNVEKAIKIWREMAESLKLELEASRKNYDEVARQVEALRKEVQKLNTISQRILKKLDKITHDNLDQMVEEIKQEIQKSNA